MIRPAARRRVRVRTAPRPSRGASWAACVRVAETLQSCATVCKACGGECERHAEMHDHCRVCAEACRRCEEARNDLIISLG